jgi:hypothetical protein
MSKSKRERNKEVLMSKRALRVANFAALVQEVFFAAGLHNQGFTLKEVEHIAKEMMEEVETNFDSYSTELGRAASIGTALILLAFEVAFEELRALWSSNQREKASALRDALESFCEGLDHTSIAHVIQLLMVSLSLVFCSFVFTFLVRARKQKRRTSGTNKNRFWFSCAIAWTN